MMNFKKHVWLIIALFLLFVFPDQASVVYGQEKQPANLDYSVPANNAVGVDPNVHITLIFTKNVVNMNVADYNKSLISLLDSKKNAVPINIQMADDQIYPEKKREVIIVPKSSLKEGETYTVYVKEGFKSKNGLTSSSPVQINFTVKEKAPEIIEKEEPKKEKEVAQTPQNNTSTKQETKVVAKDTSIEQKNESKQVQNNQKEKETIKEVEKEQVKESEETGEIRNIEENDEEDQTDVVMETTTEDDTPVDGLLDLSDESEIASETTSNKNLFIITVVIFSIIIIGGVLIGSLTSKFNKNKISN